MIAIDCKKDFVPSKAVFPLARLFTAGLGCVSTGHYTVPRVTIVVPASMAFQAG